MEEIQRRTEISGIDSFNRREVLKGVSVAGVSTVGIETVSGDSNRDTVHFIETGWWFDLGLPGNFRKQSSIVHIDRPATHSVDSENQILYLAPDTPDTVIDLFRQEERVKFEDGFEEFDSQSGRTGAKSFDDGVVPLSLSGDTRRTAGIGLSQPLNIQQPNLSTEGTDVVVEGAETDISVNQNAGGRFEFSEKSLHVEERIPAKDPRNTNETRAPLIRQREVSATPVFVIKNHGRIAVSMISENGDSQ